MQQLGAMNIFLTKLSQMTYRHIVELLYSLMLLFLWKGILLQSIMIILQRQIYSISIIIALLGYFMAY